MIPYYQTSLSDNGWHPKTKNEYALLDGTNTDQIKLRQIKRNTDQIISNN